MSAALLDRKASDAPNTGRILDYWLGGAHHEQIVVAGAKQFEAVYDGCIVEKTEE